MPPRSRPYRPLSVDSSHWRADGQAKVRFATKAEAMVVAADRGREAGLEFGVYECAFCGGWHMGSRRGRQDGRR